MIFAGHAIRMESQTISKLWGFGDEFSLRSVNSDSFLEVVTDILGWVTNKGR